jgi:predicted permease
MKSLVVAQVALPLVLLVGAGLTLRTLVNLQRVEIGFNARNLLLFDVDPKLIGYKEERLANLYKQMFERIEAVPGVQAVTFSRHPLLAKGYGDDKIYLPGARASAADGKIAPSGNVYLHQVRENFLEAMGIPLLAGRSLKAQDDERAPKVAVVNQTFARRFFPDENPVGKRFGFIADNADEIEIVGLAMDAKYTSQRAEIPPTAYLPWLQKLRSIGAMTFEVRTIGEPTAALAAIRQAVRDVDENLPLNNIRTQIEQADQTLMMERLFAKLLSLFGLLAQTLAAVGLYGSLSYQVSQRTHEIGVRMALGAQGGDVLRLVVRQGMRLALAGIALGLVGAFAVMRVLASLLYGVSAIDPLVFSSVALLLATVALVACLVPARRAMRVNPMIALRHE